MTNLKFVLSIIIGLIISLNMFGQTVLNNFKNPILPGYHPDPSIVRVGEDYYLANSTFIWYPGIPIYHSRDLVNWEQIGNAIDRPDQLNFDGLESTQGVYAVTIRYHEGIFYLITTCVNCDGNFYITATDPAGPWSDPIWLKDAPGIDPSLMWDDDGKCYYTGQNWISKQDWPTQCGIWLQELDLEQQKLVGERKILTYGHANNASYTEGPHLYKINGNYMLLLSEGGTGLYHALSVHHSESIWGPYVADLINPVLTHRHFGVKSLIQAVGHGDLVETQNGEWWAVTLGKRVIEGQTTLARETFLSKVEFEDKTPIFNNGKGKVLKEQERPNLPWFPFKVKSSKDDFEGHELGLEWCFIRIPKQKFHIIKNGQLKIKLRSEVLDSLGNSSLIIKRIEDHKFTATTKLSFKTGKQNEQAGLAIYRTNKNYYLLLKEKNDLVLIKSFKGVKEEVIRVPYNKIEVILRAEGKNNDVRFSYGESLNKMKEIEGSQSLKVIADGNGNQFNGAGIGMYASSNGVKSENHALFDWFSYEGE
ncbi:glycoside hydrolase family 43 protein [Lutibacter sp. A64]|uniref:glycoside hydrolase family 43 protein n=1 Tax=Lutibacter sp. A64 TaxID=2918526 RepID=UPI001F06813C|nr:glycoside hydrolase family 43 protein [Lutibacter sp. A64]UMB52543.1 glycoside hydrolase family 43 protein [Lutibacter sp. A64]